MIAEDFGLSHQRISQLIGVAERKERAALDRGSDPDSFEDCRNK